MGFGDTLPFDAFVGPAFLADADCCFFAPVVAELLVVLVEGDFFVETLLVEALPEEVFDVALEAFFLPVVLFATTFLAGVFFCGVLLVAVAFLLAVFFCATVFLVAAAFTVAFFGAAFFAVAFFVTAFLAATFFAVAFFAAVFLVEIFLLLAALAFGDAFLADAFFFLPVAILMNSLNISAAHC